MISIQAIAFILLIARFISIGFILAVLIKQAKQFGREIDFRLAPYLTKFERRNVYRLRTALFLLAIIIFIGNLVPIAIDYITLITDNSLGRTANVRSISIAYAFSNALTAMFSAVMIWALYKIAGVTDRQD